MTGLSLISPCFLLAGVAEALGEGLGPFLSLLSSLPVNSVRFYYPFSLIRFGLSCLKPASLLT